MRLGGGKLEVGSQKSEVGYALIRRAGAVLDDQELVAAGEGALTADGERRHGKWKLEGRAQMAEAN